MEKTPAEFAVHVKQLEAALLTLDEVLMMGDVVGAPLVAKAFASAVLVETRKGEKVKIFKKTRRQG